VPRGHAAGTGANVATVHMLDLSANATALTAPTDADPPCAIE
jgi:hypothetical protein